MFTRTVASWSRYVRGHDGLPELVQVERVKLAAVNVDGSEIAAYAESDIDAERLMRVHIGRA